MDPQPISYAIKGESRIFAFPVLNFENVPPKTMTAGAADPSGATNAIANILALGTEGYWEVQAICASAFVSAAGGLADATDWNIQVQDVETDRDFFEQSTEISSGSDLGVPVEAVAGKWGSPKWYPRRRILPPGARLKLTAAHFAAAKPTGRSPVYVGLLCRLISSPAPAAGQVRQEDFRFRGTPTSFRQLYAFSTTNLKVGAQSTQVSPINETTPFHLNSICVRGTTFGTNFINSVDPRRQEKEILLQLKSAISPSEFFQPNPMPLPLIAGQFGCRDFFPPSFFRVHAGAPLEGKILNNTDAALSADLELTFSGLILKE